MPTYGQFINGRRSLSIIAFASAVAGLVLIVIAQWENFDNADGHFYWPFIDLFGLFVTGCSLLVFALNALVWKKVLFSQPPASAKIIVWSFTIMMLVSPLVTFLVTLVLGIIASLIPR